MAHINFMKNKNLFLIISSVLFFIALIMPFIKTPNFGIDFTGGSLLQIKKEKMVNLEDIRQYLSNNNVESSVVKFGNDNEFLVKLTQKEGQLKTEEVFNILTKEYKDLELRRTEHIGAKVGGELVEKGLMSLSLTILMILIYVSFRFEWKFAVASTIAIFHDIIIVSGILVLFQVPINLDILAGLLTILGYSLNDTIVVFDRIRENLTNSRGQKLPDIINKSVNNTLSRTLLTSLTTLFVVMSIYLFGGEIINGLALTLLIGVLIGTYSSIFIASPILSVFKFNVDSWNTKLETKEKHKREREKQRKMFEQGVM